MIKTLDQLQQNMEEVDVEQHDPTRVKSTLKSFEMELNGHHDSPKAGVKGLSPLEDGVDEQYMRPKPLDLPESTHTDLSDEPEAKRQKLASTTRSEVL